jgi:phosphoglycerol transferase MdoB-like AlkP superfamily enzyme
MRKRLIVFVYYIIFWLTFMIAARILFLAYNADLSAQLTFGEILLSMLHGLRMDGSIAGYYLALTGLFLSAGALINTNTPYKILNIVTVVLILFSASVVIPDLELYRHWGFRMNNSPLFYMGAGAAGSVEVSVVIKLLAILAVFAALFIWLYFKIISPRLSELPAGTWKESLIIFVVAALMFLPIRGSFTVAPMNSGFVYFHKSKVFANHAAINVVWNFLYSIQKSDNEDYTEKFFDKEKSKTLFAELYPESDSTTLLLNTSRPNLIFIVIESFTADVVEPLGGIPGIAPNLSALCKEGVLFDNFYASGDRTDKGIIAVLSGYPAQPTSSIIKFPSKTQNLPKLNSYLKRLGYKTSFIYGGDVDFANFRSYLTTSGFDHLTTMDDFPDDINLSKWGIHDHFMFNQSLQELDTTQAPFSKVILTLSSHEPFDVPMVPYITGKDAESMFLNACHYTDKSLGDFIAAAKQKPWWKNTLIVITADHGHRHPRNKELKDKERFKIPLLFLGGAVKEDTVIHTLSGQTDIANTILAQIDKTYPEFKFSKNIMGNHVVPFAAYFFNDGYGFLKPGQYIIHDNPGKQFLRRDGADANDLDVSKAYQQTLFSDFNSR